MKHSGGGMVLLVIAVKERKGKKERVVKLSVCYKNQEEFLPACLLDPQGNVLDALLN